MTLFAKTIGANDYFYSLFCLFKIAKFEVEVTVHYHLGGMHPVVTLIISFTFPVSILLIIDLSENVTCLLESVSL